MQRHGWTLLFHRCIAEQLQRVNTAVLRAQVSAPNNFESNTNVKLLRALSHLMLEVVPGDPGRDEYRRGNTLGQGYRHWRRAKIGRRFRLFFRYDSKARIIVFAWINDQHILPDSLRLPSSTIDRKIAHNECLNTSEADRAARVLLIFSQANETFDSPELAAQWLQHAHAELGDTRPIDMLDTQSGYDRVRDILARLAYGISV